MPFEKVQPIVSETFAEGNFNHILDICLEDYRITLFTQDGVTFSTTESKSILITFFSKKYLDEKSKNLESIMEMNTSETTKIFIASATYFEDEREKQDIWINTMMKQNDEWKFAASVVYTDVDKEQSQKIIFNDHYKR